MSNQEEDMCYKLSAELLGHSSDVRVVKILEGCGIQQNEKKYFTASRDGTARVWSCDTTSSSKVELSKTIACHAGFVSSICVISSWSATGAKQSKDFYCKFHLN